MAGCSSEPTDEAGLDLTPRIDANRTPVVKTAGVFLFEPGTISLRSLSQVSKRVILRDHQPANDY